MWFVQKLQQSKVVDYKYEHFAFLWNSLGEGLLLTEIPKFSLKIHITNFIYLCIQNCITVDHECPKYYKFHNYC